MSARLFTAILTLLALASWPDRVGALEQDALQISVRYGLGLNGNAKRFHWVPVYVEINYAPRNLSATIEGEVCIRSGEDRSHTYRKALRMGSGRKSLLFHILATTEDVNSRGELALPVEVYNGKRLLLAREFRTPAASALLGRNARLIVAIGRGTMAGMRPGLIVPATNREQSEDLQRTVWFTTLPPALCPSTPQGWASADVVLLPISPRIPITEEQQLALAGFVARGGHLVVFPEAGLLESPSRELPLPAQPTPRTWKEGRAGIAWPGLAPETIPLPRGTSELVLCHLKQQSGTVIAHSRGPAKQPVCIRQTYGRGMITVTGLPLLQDDMIPWSTRGGQLFLSRLLDMPTDRSILVEVHKAAPDEAVVQPYYQHNYRVHPPVSIANNFIMSATELQPLSALWVSLFLIGFFLIAGPINTCWLRQTGRMRWTYPVFAATCLVFFLIAYVGAYVIKGNDCFQRELTILDRTAPGNYRSTGFVGLYSAFPQAFSMPAEAGRFLHGLAVFRPNPYMPWESATISPTAGEAEIRCGDRSTAPAQIALRQWTIHSFVSTGALAMKGGLELSGVRFRNNRLHTAKVQNTCDLSFERVYLFTDRGIYSLGGLSSGASRKLQSPVASPLVDACVSAIGLQDYNSGMSHHDRDGALTLERLLFLSFPALMKACHRTCVGQREDGGTFLRPLKGDHLRLLAKPLGPMAKLSLWQQLSCRSRTEDDQQLDLTRFLCQGRAVLIGISKTPVPQLQLHPAMTRRNAQTVVRSVSPFSRINND